ncbi:lytic transglycosylase domain-containing protein [Hydrogenophaga atypica]|uniref:Transglycosylase SLT domain-containing protein n=1 Tax=Hydrogenophaga atypica TaxID=249409 RepID=A0ABW2QF06_9BURK
MSRTPSRHTTWMAGIFAGLLLSALPAARAQIDTALPGDKLVLELREAFRKGDTRTLGQKLPQLDGHPLQPLAAYWDMKLRLEWASADDVRAFTERYAGSYYEDRLRNDWLLLLGRRGDWATFATELPRFRMNDDREVQCYGLLVQHQNTGADVAEAVRDRWMAQKEADEGCSRAARELTGAGKLPALATWHRARQGMERGRQRVVAQAVGQLNPEWVATANEIYANPARYLDDKLTAIRPRTKELVTLALVRLAATDVEDAIAELGKARWRAQLTAEERSWVWGVIGKRSAQKLSDEALDHFAQARDEHLSDEQRAWKVRAALRAGHWGLVRQTIEGMRAEQRDEPAWTYWLARAIQAPGNNPQASAQARALYERIASHSGFYEQLAIEELGQKITAPPPPAPLTAEERAAALGHPGLLRALHALRVGLRSEGVREWNYSTNLHIPGGMPERELLAAAQLACDRAIWDRCINTSERTRTVADFSQRYPTPFREAVLRRSADIGLDPAYVYGLIRQESRFVMDARSHVGASGLMQVMPATARWTARKIGLDGFQPHHINDKETNIAIGTAYLKFALDDFEGSMPMAAAAYNAGPGRPRNWRNGPLLEAAAWAESIPFDETRDYVKKVLANTTSYAALLTGQGQSLKARLGWVGPRAATAQTVNRDLP